MTEAAKPNPDMQEPAGISVPLVSLAAAELASLAVVEHLKENDASPDAVTLQLSNPMPTATGMEIGSHEFRPTSELSLAGEVGILAAPLVLASAVLAIHMRWRHRRQAKAQAAEA